MRLLVILLQFGAGARMCPGKSIAMNNLATITCFIAQRWQVAEIPDRPVSFRTAIGLSIQTSDRLLFTPRASASGR
jgi:cytochrome P450